MRVLPLNDVYEKSVSCPLQLQKSPTPSVLAHPKAKPGDEDEDGAVERHSKAAAATGNALEGAHPEGKCGVMQKVDGSTPPVWYHRLRKLCFPRSKHK